jgi:hypothetical protein
VRKVPGYYGLSYCWGSSERVTRITCNGKPLQISGHLSQGLKELQSIPELAQKWFWIDQICVNQDDVDERTHQVKLMREIYTRAISTVIWIGVCEESCEKAFFLAQDICRICQADKHSSKGEYAKWKIPLPGDLYEEELLSLNLPDLSDPSWRELKALFAKSWFRRMWIIQEVVLSRKKPLLVYGSRVRNWEHVLWTSFWIRQRASTLVADVIGTENISPLNNLFLIWATVKSWGLQDLLLGTQYSRSTDPRDKIFSLLSIAAETQGKATLPALLVPNYEKEFERVYRDVTYYLISTSRNLLLFSLIGENENPTLACRQDSATLPSWVPRFHNLRHYHSAYSFRLEENRISYIATRKRASKDTLALVQESQDPNVLILQGFKIDTVKWKSEKSSLDKEPFLALRWCEEGACRLIPSKYRTFQDYSKTFLGVISNGGTRGIPPSHDEFWDYLGAEGISSPNLIYFLKFLKETRSEETHNGDGNLAFWISRYTSGESNFFLTEKQVMGIGPPAMQEGDIICVLFGGQSPLALRPCHDHYHLLGECYVSELIGGQAIDEWKGNERKEEWFTLR